VAITNQEIQVSAHKKRLEDPIGARGGPEKYLDFLELKKIVEQKENWNHFEPIFNIKLLDQQKGLAKYIKWFDEVNRIRRVSAHPYQRTYSQNDLEILQTVVKKLSAYMSNVVRLENAVN
jgi:DNA sulfur modification protein DndB